MLVLQAREPELDDEAMRQIWEEDPGAFFQVDIFSPPSMPSPAKQAMEDQEAEESVNEPLTSSDEDSICWRKAMALWLSQLNIPNMFCPLQPSLQPSLLQVLPVSPEPPSENLDEDHAEHAGKALKPGLVPQNILDEIRKGLKEDYPDDGPVPEPARTKRALDCPRPN